MILWREIPPSRTAGSWFALALRHRYFGTYGVRTWGGWGYPPSTGVGRSPPGVEPASGGFPRLRTSEALDGRTDSSAWSKPGVPGIVPREGMGKMPIETLCSVI